MELGFHSHKESDTKLGEGDLAPMKDLRPDINRGPTILFNSDITYLELIYLTK